MGLPRVGTRPLGESFWTRREVCSNALEGIVVDVGELIEGDIVRAFFGRGSLVVVEEEVM
jgi:hypothetical protein